MQNTNQKPKAFQLNKTDISKLGLEITSERPLYPDFISPFQQDQQKPHPLCIQIPQGFTAFEFTFQKISNRIQQDGFIYIFYNIIDQRLQLQAARSLMDKGLKYHKFHKIWIKKKQAKFQYFNINQWKFMDYTQNINNQDFCTKQDFADKAID